MRLGDPRFSNFPAQPGTEQLRWYIRSAAEGVLNIHEFLADFRRVHEAVERSGTPDYGSPAEARAIWDVLWAVEFCAVDAPPQQSPRDWYLPEEVLAVVKRAARQLPGGHA